MIRLKLLLEDNDVDPKNKTINVLFIGDKELFDTWSFSRKLAKSGIIVAEQEIFKASRDL